MTHSKLASGKSILSAFMAKSEISRSGMAAQAFGASGYDAYNLEGGFVAWLERDLPAEPENAVAARQSVFMN